MTDEAPRPPLAQDIHARLQRDRLHTDGSLHQERAVTDEVTAWPLERVVDDLRDDHRARIDEVVEQSRDRLDARVRESVEALPQIADALTEVVGNLSAVAETLNEAARSTAAATPASAAEREAAETLSSVVETLSEAAGIDVPASAAPVAGAPDVTERLADVAESMAEVAQRVADEREAADSLLVEERALIDRLLGREREQVDRSVEFERQERRRLVEAARRRTNERLRLERRDTDEAVHHSIELLREEQSARETAEDRVLTRDEILAIVSHDLRSPLDVIVINAALLAENAPAGEMQARLQRWATNIERSAAAMERLVSDLLDVARFEGGSFSITPEPYDAVRLMKECVESFAALAAYRGLRFDVDLPGAPVPVTFDHPRMLQVMFNLLRNALQFTPPGGSILLSLTPRPSGCRIAVRDSGPGIPPAQQARLFERFHQVTSSDRRGLGLGLYIARRIVDAHQGRIWVESDVGRGSTFYVELP